MSRPGALLALALALAAMPAGRAMAQTALAAADTQAEIARGLEAQFQVSLIRERKLADDRETAELQAAETRLLAAHKAAAAAQGDARAAQTELVSARADYARLAAALSAKDAEAKAEIEAYHQQIADLTRTNDPELTQALAAYADGDRVGAYPIIKRILLAENAAAEAGVRERNAERLRDLATDAVEMAERGEGPVQEAIDEWEAAQAASPTLPGWDALTSLYLEVGRVPDALAAGQKMLDATTDPHDRAGALIQLGAITARTGDLEHAHDLLLQSVAILKTLNPQTDAVAADLWRSAYGNLEALADAQADAKSAMQYDQDEARPFAAAKPGSTASAAPADANAGLYADLDREADRNDWTAAEATARQLIDAVKQSDAYAKADDVEKASLLYYPLEALYGAVKSEADANGGAPATLAALHDVLTQRVTLQQTLVQRQHIVGVDFNYLGEAMLDLIIFDVDVGNDDEARQLGDKLIAAQDARHTDTSQDLYEELILARALRTSADAILDVDPASRAPGDLADAAARSRRAAAILAPFAAAASAPAYVVYQEALDLLTLGKALLVSGDLPGALGPMRDANGLFEKLALAHPGDSDLTPYLWQSRYGLAKLTNEPARWRQLEAFLAAEEKSGGLNPQLASWLAEARGHLAAPTDASASTRR